MGYAGKLFMLTKVGVFAPSYDIGLRCLVTEADSYWLGEINGTPDL